jgi:hypothetical protein
MRQGERDGFAVDGSKPPSCWLLARTRRGARRLLAVDYGNPRDRQFVSRWALPTAFSGSGHALYWQTFCYPLLLFGNHVDCHFSYRSTVVFPAGL